MHDLSVVLRAGGVMETRPAPARGHQSPEGIAPLGVRVSVCIADHLRDLFVCPSKSSNPLGFFDTYLLSEMLCGRCCRGRKGIVIPGGK